MANLESRSKIFRYIANKHGDRLRALPIKSRISAVDNIKLFVFDENRTEDELFKFISSKVGAEPEEITRQIQETEQGIRDEYIASQRGLGMAGIGRHGELKGRLTALKHTSELNQLGIDTDTPLPAGDVEMGFGLDPAKSLGKALSKHFGKEVYIFKRGDDTLFIHPETNVVTLVNPGIAGSTGEGLVAAGDVFGTIVGGFIGGLATKNPAGIIAGEATGSGFGTTATEYIRLKVGKEIFGVHNASDDEMIDKAISKGKTAAIFTGATGGFIAGAKNIRNLIKGRVLTKTEALKHGLSSQEADEFFNAVNDILGAQGKVKGTLFSRTGDVNIGAKEAELRNTFEHAKEFADRDIADQDAITRALDIITKPADKVSGGAAIQDVAEKQIAKRTSQAKKVVETSEASFDKQLKSLTSTAKEQAGKPVREVIIQKRNAEKLAEKAEWSKVQKIGGYNEASKTFGIEVPRGTEINRLNRILSARSKQAQTKTEQAGTDIFTDSKKIKEDQIIKTGQRGQIKFSGKDKVVPKQDLNNLQAELSNLRKKRRQIGKGLQFTDKQAKEFDDVISAMEADRRLELTKIGRGDLLKQIETAELKTAKFHEKFSRSVLGDLTSRKESGVFKIQEKDFVDKTLKGSAADAAELNSIIKENPGVQSQFKEGIADAFRRDILEKLNIETGSKLKPAIRDKLRKKVNDWIVQRKDVLDEFFSKDEINNIRRTGDMAILVKKQNAQLQGILNKSKKFGRGKLSSLDPRAIVKWVTNDTGSFITPTGRGVSDKLGKIDYIKKSTSKHPGVWAKFKQEFSTSMRNNIVDLESGKISHKNISRWVNNEPETIVKIMGEEYLKNLKSVNKVVQLLNRQPKTLNKDESKAIISAVIRTVWAAPLTKEGKAFTAASMFSTKESRKFIAKAILNPSDLNKMAKLSEHNKFTRETAELAISLGLITGDD